MKKKAITVIMICTLCILSAVIGAYAATAITKITAELRPDFTVVIDGQERVFKNAQGEVVYPVLYEGTTYLPLRAIGELMGKTVYWYEDAKRIELKDDSLTVTDADVIVTGEGGSAAGTPAGTQPASPASITEAQAKEIALKEAGLTGGDVKFERVQLDREDGRLVYEVEFYTVGADGRRLVEYDAEIDAGTGAVLKWEKDLD